VFVTRKLYFFPKEAQQSRKDVVARELAVPILLAPGGVALNPFLQEENAGVPADDKDLGIPEQDTGSAAAL